MYLLSSSISHIKPKEFFRLGLHDQEEKTRDNQVGRQIVQGEKMNHNQQRNHKFPAVLGGGDGFLTNPPAPLIKLGRYKNEKEI